METLPPVMLGVTILLPLLPVLILHRKFESFFVLNHNEFKQTLRQFQLDLGLYIFIGACVAVYNYFIYGFPVASGVSFMFGSLVIGFFIALDMALWRERCLIQKARMDNALFTPPERLYPMSRRFSTVAIVTAFFVITVMAMVISRDFDWLNSTGSEPSRLLTAQRSVILEIIFITAILLIQIINLIISYSKNLKLLFNNETGILKKVSQGDLSALVPVVTQDEFGLIAGHTNLMIEGLRHRSELMTSIKLAEEVQRNLLPGEPPKIKDLDVAGASIYCKETGGDYFDYFTLPNNRLAIVVADAADHGLGSAMQMTSARAFLKATMGRYQNPAQVVTEVNEYLTRDSRNTGRFMTLFFLEIDPNKRQLSWVRAGHEPALFHNPATGQIEILAGPGVALGILEKTTYTTQYLNNWPQKALLLIGTDGVWETRNSSGEMFGKEKICKMMNSAAKQHQSARQLLDGILTHVNLWRDKKEQEDDITLVTAVLP